MAGKRLPLILRDAGKQRQPRADYSIIDRKCQRQAFVAMRQVKFAGQWRNPKASAIKDLVTSV